MKLQKVVTTISAAALMFTLTGCGNNSELSNAFANNPQNGQMSDATLNPFEIIPAEKRILPIYSVECTEKKIAITFDVARENSNTWELVGILKDNGAKATFFVTGDWCDRYPDDVKIFFDAGHEIENHSDQHPHVLGANVNDLISDTRECTRKIKMLTGEEPTLYRAPYGEFDDSLITTLDDMGMKVIQWSVDSVDLKNPTAEIKKKVLNGVKPGSILLFHNDLANTTEALPEILSNLKSQGYEFVTVKELINNSNYNGN